MLRTVVLVAALEVQEYSPPRDGHGVLPDTKISLTFDGPIVLSEAADEKSITLLTDPSKYTRQSIAPTGFTVEDDRRKLVYTPPKALAAGQLYTVLFDAGLVRSAETDEEFRAFTIEHQPYRFTVLDPDPPRVVGCEPSSEDVALDANIQLRFSEDVKPRVGVVLVIGGGESRRVNVWDRQA